MENNNLQQNNNEQEIDLIEVAKRLWTKRKFILKVTGAFMVLGLLVAVFSAKEYTAGCLVVPQTGSKSGGGSLSGLAAMAGISLGNIGEGETLSPKIYSKVLNNIDLQKELMNTPIHFEGYEQPITLLDYYTKEEYQKFSLMGTILKYTVGLPGVILGAIRGEQVEKPIPANGSEKQLSAFTKDEQACIKVLRSRYSLTINDKDGYVSISANMPEPLAAAQIAQQLQDLLQKYVTEFKIQKAQANYNFVKQRYDEAKIVYEAKQEEYAKFQDANRSLSSALSRTKEEQIKSEYSIANSLFGELSKQLVQAEIKVKEDTPILTVVEPVVVPREKSKPKRPMILVMFTFLGGFLGCGLVFGADFLKKNSELAYLKNW
ncbi:MAG: Wzz/FepE/Etk N-terminal domain-containing protein [Bacteroidales bacterium]